MNRIGARTSIVFLLLAALPGACRVGSVPGQSDSGAASAAASVANAPPAELGTASQADSLLVDVQRLAPDIRVEMRYTTANNFTGAPLPGYEANRALARREAAVALARVQQGLRGRGLGLLVYDAYRPVRATEAMVAWTERVGRQDLVRDGYIASRSRHNLGVAIDLTLIDLATGRPLDMGTAYDEFSAAAHTANASGGIAERRRWLVEAMESEGFVNYDQEWWHFSFEVPNPLRFDVVVR
jgi:D-alanyl-D-alanine dipeptidase